jgi:hypothetical protein
MAFATVSHRCCGVANIAARARAKAGVAVSLDEVIHDRVDRLDRLVPFLLIAFVILLVKDCYQRTHAPVCECRGLNESEGLYGPPEKPADTDAAVQPIDGGSESESGT